MRGWKMASGMAAALVIAWVTVARLAWAAEFACTIPWHGGTECGIPKFTIRAHEKLTIEMTSVKIDGQDLDKPCPKFQIFDINNNDTLLDTLEICVGKSGSYQNKNKETDQTVRLRVNIAKVANVDIQGSYKVSK